MSDAVSDGLLGLSILLFSVIVAYGTIWFDYWFDWRSDDRGDDE